MSDSRERDFCWSPATYEAGLCCWNPSDCAFRKRDVIDEARDELASLRSALSAATERAEKAERERDQAIKLGWKAAHDCIAYCVANWHQDARTKEYDASLSVIQEYLADMRRESPDEYLDMEWRGVEEAEAATARAEALSARVKELEAKLAQAG